MPETGLSFMPSPPHEDHVVDVRLAYVQGASSSSIQEELRRFGRLLLQRGFAVAGMTEVPSVHQTAMDDGTAIIQDLCSGQEYTIYQDLGSSSLSCSLDSTGLTAAAGALEAALQSPCDLVIISKFGKEEIAGRGFCDAFRLAFLKDIPVLTSVNPLFGREWSAFTADAGLKLGASPGEITLWWEDVLRAAQAPASP